MVGFCVLRRFVFFASATYSSRIFFFKQKTAYEMRISDWSSDVCFSDLDLLEFVPHWIGVTAQERWDIRARATMAEITRFYDVLLSRSEAILDHVETFPLDAMPAPTLRLFRLQLALAHAAMSVELHKQPRAHNSPYPHQV